MEQLTTLELLLAIYLVDFYRYSFSVRMQGIFATGGTFDPPEVRELVNLLQWCGDGLPDTMKLAHARGLQNVIKHNAKELKIHLDKMKAGTVSTHAIDAVNRLNQELTAADEMMEYLSNG